MADKEAPVKLVHPNGVTVSVRESKAKILRGQGFKKPAEKKSE